jgi:flagellar biosynthesis/type III secretory pathway ATPase
MAAHEDAKDLISIGAYVRGADAAVDQAMTLLPSLNGYLRQPADEITPYDQSVLVLRALSGEQINEEDANAVDGEAIEAPDSLS